jgi:hypothetical protein
MVTYEVTATIDPDIADRYEQYMQLRHVPDLLATGCFVRASFSRSAPGRYRIRYEAPDQATLDSYLARHAAELREHVDREFPRGVVLSRETWTVLRSWEARRDEAQGSQS